MNTTLTFCSVIACLLFTQSSIAAVFLEGYPEPNALTQVADDGKIKVITLNATPELSESIDTGSNRPSVAPSLQSVAFVRDNNLWVKNLSASQEQKITKFASPNPSIDVKIMAWSPNTQQILYSVQPVETMDDLPPETKLPKVDYGFYVYDFATSTHRPTRLSHRFLGWLDKDYFLMLETKVSPQPEKLIRWHWLRGDLLQLSKAPLQGLGQVTFSADRLWAVAAVGPIGESSQIMKINLQTGDLVKAGPLGAFTEYQWPSFSPNGAQIATLWRKKGSPQTTTQLLVEGRLVWPAVDEYKWVNNDIIAVVNRCGLSVIKVDSGIRIAYYPKPKTKSAEGDVNQAPSGIKCD